jgi:hypothetical protein
MHEARPMFVRYVLVPDALIRAFADDPLAVGVYVAVARLAMVAKAAVPLAARDLVLWMGSDRDADRVAIMRRIVKLESRGWLIITRTMAAKHGLLPTWGRDQAGAARAWCFESPDSGRPQHLRGRRIPIGLFDDYLGRLEPQPTAGRALISRYFTRPLLNLTDIGVYTIGLRAEIMPTPGLQHLELCNEAGMLPLPDTQFLLAQAAGGALTTCLDDVTVPVRLSVHGYARLGLHAPIINQPLHITTVRLDGSPHGSPDGSSDTAAKLSRIVGQEAIHRVANTPTTLIAWDVGMIHESTNHDSTADHVLGHDGGAVTMPGEYYVAATAEPNTSVHPTNALSVPSRTPFEVQSRIEDTAEQHTPPVSDCVVEGHRALNAHRRILAGEWYELLRLQEAHGVEQLLIWQARASRVVREGSIGITPGYYHTCAARAECEAYQPRSQFYKIVMATPALPEHSTSVPVWADSRCEPLLQLMGVRERQKLAAVSYELITCWQLALAHPGMAARFTSPVGFAVAQMQRGKQPPPIAELDRWADQVQRTNERYELWRYIASPATIVDRTMDEQQLEARVRSIAPPNADLADLCLLANALESGATDAEALAQLGTSSVGDLE